MGILVVTVCVLEESVRILVIYQFIRTIVGTHMDSLCKIISNVNCYNRDYISMYKQEKILKWVLSCDW